MRVASVIAQDLASARTQIGCALPVTDIIELRLDCWSQIDLQAVQILRNETALPLMFTLRTQSQGGNYNQDEQQRLTLIAQLAALEPDYLDLEFDVSLEFVSALHAQHPNIQLIRSYHDFTQTPADLDALLQQLYHPAFQLFKIATYANNILDTLRLLIFLRRISTAHRVIGIAMGEYGQASRILSPIVGSAFTYGCIDAETAAAPGQLTLDELTRLYRLPELNRDTQIYALLGDPVVHSRGHVLHNQAFARLNKNALYVKLKVDPDCLEPAVSLLRQLPFAGFSVTMPHKETIVPLVERLADDAKATGIVNTIKRDGSYYCGFNTDSRAGAILLQRKFDSLQGQKIVVLGAGGSAKAIAYALLAAGAQVTLCNRSLARAQNFNREHGGDCISFAALLALVDFPYTAIVNTLPMAAYAEQCSEWRIPAPGNGKPHVAMDIVYTFSNDLRQASITPFLQTAKNAGWDCISGDKFFNEQALQQLQIWFDLQPAMLALVT